VECVANGAGRVFQSGKLQSGRAPGETTGDRTLYREYIKAQKTPGVDVRKRLKTLQKNPKGSNELDYFCEDYED
jgi:hypothetical protein